VPSVVEVERAVSIQPCWPLRLMTFLLFALTKRFRHHRPYLPAEMSVGGGRVLKPFSDKHCIRKFVDISWWVFYSRILCVRR
jgi:hypothetical protein